MKNNKNVASRRKINKVQSKPSFKPKQTKPVTVQPRNKRNPKNDKPKVRNHFTIAEEKRLDRIREQNERKAEKEAKKLVAKKEQKRKMKILSKKTSRGQPVMKGRMELLLEKIEKRMAN